MWWCIPGSPLPEGKGWRLWYAAPGPDPFQPSAVRVHRAADGARVSTTQTVEVQPSLPGFDRRTALVDVLLDAPEPGERFDVHVPETGVTHRWSTLPSAIPEAGLAFLLVSCFWLEDDRDGAFATALRSVVKRERPVFKLHIGDQIYLDWPSSFRLREGAAELTARRYREYWGNEPYREALSLAPSFFLCDDHEYWNDYPERQIHLSRSLTESSRNEHAQIAEEYYRAFVRRLNPGGADRAWSQIELPPASFFLADTRSERTYHDGRPNPIDPQPGGQGAFMSPAQWQALEAWQHGLTGPGILVLGQPLLQEDGDWRDHSLSNFRMDYARLLRLFERSQAGQNAEGRPHDIVVLSGDIHTGRHARVYTTTGEPVHEIIASPASCVGPFKSVPTPYRPPSKLPTGPRPGSSPWRVETDGGEYFETVDNNLGVIRLVPSRKQPYRLRLEFDACFVRSAHQPAWAQIRDRVSFWRDRPPPPTAGAVLNRGARPIDLR